MSTSAADFLDYVRPHWRRLRAVARQYATGSEEARDLVQEVLLRAWRNFAPMDERVYHRAWLFVILRNVAAEWHRTRQRRIRLVPVMNAELTELAASDPSEPFTSMPNMDEDAFREYLDDRIVAAMDALDAPFREVLLLSVAGGLNYREIAEVLDCPMGTVMSRMARTRRMLRERLADFAREHGHLREARS